MVLFFLLRKELVQHLLVLIEEGQKVHLHIAARAVFEHLLHGLEDASGVLPVLVDGAQVIRQHAKHVQGVLIIVLVDVLLIIINVLLEVSQQVIRHLGEVDDVVHGVQDTVDESFGELTHSGHFLLTYQLVLGIAQVVEGFLQTLRLLLDLVFLPDNLVLLTDNLGSALPDDALQLDLILLQPLQPVAEQAVDQQGEEDEVEHKHVPAHQQGVVDGEADGSLF